MKLFTFLDKDLDERMGSEWLLTGLNLSGLAEYFAGKILWTSGFYNTLASFMGFV